MVVAWYNFLFIVLYIISCVTYIRLSLAHLAEMQRSFSNADSSAVVRRRLSSVGVNFSPKIL